ncbi:MAG: rod shape-determining protein MreC [Clostridia bacterium]|nr:rod shape-determining protein MreC [Clostridia bacterium]
MPRDKRRKRHEDEDLLTDEEELFDPDEVESLDDITAGLPGMEDTPPAPAKASADEDAEEEESAFQTPDVVMARFKAAREAENEGKRPRKKKKKKAKAAEDGEDKPVRRGLFGRRRSESRLVELEADTDEPLIEPFRKRHPTLRIFLLVLVTVILSLFLATAILSQVVGTYEDTAGLAGIASLPQRMVVTLVTPLQRGFSAAVDGVTGFFSRMALLLRIEEAYNEVVAENEQLVYQAKMAEEYQRRLAQYENLQDEVTADRAMSPITARVIGRSDGNYFSTFTIDKGSADGLGQYMAVTSDGALIGYTESVEAHSTLVRTIIDSEASIAALIESSRDQGVVVGTLGVDGTAMCRMYYLPDDHLPRPGDRVVTSGVGMSFPKGIPIGTVRESTRGLASNKQYIVVDPDADFQHIEYVIVYLYKPAPEAAQNRESSSVTADDFVPLETGRPYPTIRTGDMNYFGVTATPAPLVEETPTPSPSPTPTPYHTIEPYETPAPDYHDNTVEYVPIHTEETPTDVPTATPSPTPTPYNTLAPNMLTLEEEE